MQQFGVNSRVRAHRERQAAFWSRQSSCTLKQTHSTCAEAKERSPRRALLDGWPPRLLGRHLQLPTENVRHDRCQEPSVVDGEVCAGAVVDPSLGLQLGEESFLRALTVVQRQRLAGREHHSGQDRLELVAVRIGSEHGQLRRLLALLRFPSADDEKAPILLLSLWFPPKREEARHSIHLVPLPVFLDLCLEHGDALEGHRDGEEDCEGFQHPGDLIGQVGAVHPRLHNWLEQDLAGFTDAGDDEGAHAVAVVDVVGCLVEIARAPSLGHRAEERMVASLPFLLVVADRDSFRPPRSAQHRAVEAQFQSKNGHLIEPIERDRARCCLTACFSTASRLRLTVAKFDICFRTGSHSTIGLSCWRRRSCSRH